MDLEIATVPKEPKMLCEEVYSCRYFTLNTYIGVKRVKPVLFACALCAFLALLRV